MICELVHLFLWMLLQHLCVKFVIFFCLEFLSLKTGNASTISTESPLRCILDQRSDHSSEPMRERKVFY